MRPTASTASATQASNDPVTRPLELECRSTKDYSRDAVTFRSLKEAWAAIGAPGQWDAHLSWEPRTVDAAALAGSVLAESAPSSALRSQLRDLAGSVLRRLDGDLSPDQDEVEDVRGTRLGRAVGGWLRR